MIRLRYIPLYILCGFLRKVLKALPNEVVMDEEPPEEEEEEEESFVVPMVELLETGEDAQARVGGSGGRVLGQMDIESKRYIFRWKDFVIKIDPACDGDSGDRYDYQAVKEWRVYRTIKPEDKVYFAEVVGLGTTTCGRSFSVQRFIPNIVPLCDWSDDHDVRTSMGDHAQMVADKYGIYDIGWSNFGVVDDEPMLYDLGATYYLRDHPKVGEGRDCECETCKLRSKIDKADAAGCDCAVCRKRQASI